ncbi:hypothetical protein O9993_18000 [Vibrio lentus]|nr:hypothetical protein [Vibrio lentus]
MRQRVKRLLMKTILLDWFGSTEDTIINGLFTVDEGADGVVKYELVDEDLVLAGLT